MGKLVDNFVSRVKSNVRNYAATKIENAVNGAKRLIGQKCREILNNILPSNPFTHSKPDSPERTNSNGLDLSTEGGKDGIVKTKTTGNTKKVQVDPIMMGTDILGPTTKVPGVAPDGSNPFGEGNTPGTVSSMPTATINEMVTVERIKYGATPVIGGGSGAESSINASSEKVNVSREEAVKITTANTKDSIKAVKDRDNNNQQINSN